MMGAKSKIEWTDSSWSPIRAQSLLTGKPGWHCEHVTPGCENCYSERLNLRLGTGYPFKPGHKRDVRLFLDDKMLHAPLRWKRPRMIFVCSMTDLFADFVPDEWIDQMFAIMALCPQHTFQVLTKRSARMREYALNVDTQALENAENQLWATHKGERPNEHLYPPPNVWLGVSAEDQEWADERIPDLLNTPAAIRFVSYEPALGPVDFQHIADNGTTEHDALTGEHLFSEVPLGRKLDWVIAGGESGPNARPANPQWFRDVRDQCATAGVPFHFKQWGEWVSVSEAEGPGAHFHFPDGRTVRRIGKKLAGRLLDGREHNGLPAPTDQEDR